MLDHVKFGARDDSAAKAFIEPALACGCLAFPIGPQ